jgi:hypothetical protein
MYTHKVVIKLGDGGLFLTADLGFDDKGKALVKIVKTSEPFTLDFVDTFSKLVTLIETLRTQTGGIKTIIIKDITYTDADAKEAVKVVATP